MIGGAIQGAKNLLIGLGVTFKNMISKPTTSHKKKCSNHWFGSNIQILISRIMLNFSFWRLGGHYFGVRWHRYPISRSVLVVDVLGCLQFSYELLSPRIGEEPSIPISVSFP